MRAPLGFGRGGEAERIVQRMQAEAARIMQPMEIARRMQRLAHPVGRPRLDRRAAGRCGDRRVAVRRAGAHGGGLPAARDGAIVLWVVWRPRLTGDLRLAAAFGVALGLMNWSFYEAIARIPLGAAVTIEFAGPLLVGVIGSRRPLDVLWVALARWAS